MIDKESDKVLLEKFSLHMIEFSQKNPCNKETFLSIMSTYLLISLINAGMNEKSFVEWAKTLGNCYKIAKQDLEK